MKNQKFLLVFMCLLLDASNGCKNIWDTSYKEFTAPEFTSTDACQVPTTTDEICQFPFRHNGVDYNRCLIDKSVQGSYLPMCKIKSGAWRRCQVPTNAIITKVTTSRKGNSYNAGTEGGTLVYISGLRFAPEAFSISRTASTSNTVKLVSEFSSYDCDIFVDLTSSTEIACYTKKMPVGTYKVKVFVKGQIIPFYQYTSQAIIRVYSKNTPYISEVTPNSGIPGTLIDIDGDFKTDCFARDKLGCGHEYDTRISRVYFGGQQCELINPATNDIYQEVTTKKMKCKLNKAEVNYFLGSMMVSNEFGRSRTNQMINYISPDENIFNFQTYAEIDNVSPRNGSMNGGTLITITGKYLYTDNIVPASINVGGQPCKVKSFNQDDYLQARITCETERNQNSTEYFGNRGITLLKSSAVTNDLANAVRPSDVDAQILDELFYTKNSAGTVFLTGFLFPGKYSNYTFSVSTDGNAALFLSTNKNSENKVQVASKNNPSTVSLQANTEYFIELVASRNKKFYVKANMKMLNTIVTEDMTGFAFNQKSEIEINSDGLPEEYEIAYNDFNETNKTIDNEIQILSIPSDAADYILKFKDLTTGIIKLNAAASDIQNALNDIPYFHENLVNVSESINDMKNGNETFNRNFTIEFPQYFGDAPELEVIGNLTWKIEELTKGIPNNTTVQVSIEGRKSAPFDLRDKASTIRAALMDSFNVKCPKSIVNQNKEEVIYMNDFETNCANNPPKFPNSTAFCGQCSQSNNGWLINNMNLSMSYSTVCFAYRTLTPITQMKFTIVNKNGELTDELLTRIGVQADGDWHYFCADLFPAYQFMAKDFRSAKDELKIHKLSVSPVNQNTLIDVVSIRKNAPESHDHSSLTHTRRLVPSFEITRGSFVVSKGKEDETNTIKIVYDNGDCIPIKKPMALVMDTEYSAIKRVSATSPPVTGTYGLAWNDKSIQNIDARIESINLKKMLESVEGFETVDIIRSKNCLGYKWSIKWKQGGLKPDITILANALQGDNPKITAKTTQLGGANFSPIPGSMLRTVHQTPQVTVSVNNILSKCSNSCSFEWSQSATPTVETIDASSQNAIVIKGSGFEAKASDNLVFIGKVPCKVTSATETEIICSAGDNTAGDYSISVNVVGKGLATIKQSPIITFELEATSILPKTSYTGGGVTLSVFGTRFSLNSTVSIDGINCKTIFANFTCIKCIVPENPTQANKEVNVVVSEGLSTSTVQEKFLYDFSSTPVVTSVEPSLFNVTGEAEIVILGSNLPQNLSTVKIGEKVVKVTFSSLTRVELKAPAMQPGLYELAIQNPVYGNAKISKKLQYRLYVSSFSPRVSSAEGGTMVNVYGEGFSQDCSQNKVKFGKKSCKVVNCTSDWIKCETDYSYTTHQINNDATDPYYGYGFAWSKPFITINTGDYVEWSWKVPDGVQDIKYQVLQAENAVRKNLDFGFGSGEPSESGNFKHQFLESGTYYYWSGYVESSLQITFRGVIEVKSTSDNTEMKLDVSVLEYKAQKCSFPFIYKSVEYKECINTDSDYKWCSPANSEQKLRCDPIAEAISETCQETTLNPQTCGVNAPASIYNMLFTKCPNNVPNMLNISESKLTYDDSLIITGTRFSTIACENRVRIGDVKCEVISASSTEIRCKLGLNSGLKANSVYPVQLSVNNYGFAVKETLFSLRFFPRVASYTPTIGSNAGGTKIVITGDGFNPDNTLIIIGTSSYHQNSNAQITKNKIIIDTFPGTNATHEIQVFVNRAKAVCNNCTFKFSEKVTPKIDSISPLTVNETTLMTIDGSFPGTNISQTSVRVGNEDCQVKTLNSNQLTCLLNGLELNENKVTINIEGMGNGIVDSGLNVIGLPTFEDAVPKAGSVHGGSILTLTGNGFDKTTQVMLGQNSPCKIVTVSTTTLTCQTGKIQLAENENSKDVAIVIRTNNEVHKISESLNFTYNKALTPVINSISPANGAAANLTISGSKFGSTLEKINVFIGDAPCQITSVSDNEIKCSLGPNRAGENNIHINREDFGLANSDVVYKYDLLVSSLSQTEGTVGGGLKLTINGTGFSKDSAVTICDKNCTVISGDFSSLSLLVPESSNKNSNTNCELKVKENGIETTASFRYSLSISPKVTDVSPKRGGTGGGTLLTITGSNFPNDKAMIKIDIAGSECKIDTVTSNEIKCRTESYRKSSIKALINVFVNEKGLAINDGTVKFEYIDLWSSKYTWGGMSPPGEGELAIISKGQHIYFDAATTPTLKGLIIQEGSLIFDDNQDVSLNVEYILILDGGKLQVGTEAAPFKHKAIITMFGHPRSTELPIFGSKVLGLREGTLDLHGLPVGVTWTHLEMTASEGSNEITLKEPVMWPVGSEIVIAPTGNKFSVGRHDKRTIVSKSNNGRTLTLDKPLGFEHLSEVKSFASGTETVYTHKQAEVGLLSRNVIFRGHNDDSWNRLFASEGCSKTFNPSESAVMTCFLGRYGPELGSDQFGGTIMVAVGEDARNSENAIVRISNVEFFHVGQSFRLGRYPIHFHLNGDMPSSYVKECAIHESFNRAVNVHATNYVTIDRNVIFNIRGGAFFLEAGNEIGNVFSQNLAIFVQHASSLMNEDVTPAAFWATNPNNTYIHNAVAGCSHFGFWYRTSGCATRAPVAAFRNNTVHSVGRYGLWVFPGIAPTHSGKCNDRNPGLAIFSNFTTYGCDKGIEYIDSNNIQLNGIVAFDIHHFAIETCKVLWMKKINMYNLEKGPAVQDSIIIGNTNSDAKEAITKTGLVIANNVGHMVSNVRFINFPGNNPAIRTTRFFKTMGCEKACGGYTTKFQKMAFNNVRYRATQQWAWNNVLRDLDGTLTGLPLKDSQQLNVVYKDDMAMNNPSCQTTENFNKGMLCYTDGSWIRFGFKADGEYTYFEDMRGSVIKSPKMMLRLTHGNGMMVDLQSNQEYLMYENALVSITNISYSGALYYVYPNEYLIFKHRLAMKPDRVEINGRHNSMSNGTLSIENISGDWTWDEESMEVSYIVINKNGSPRDIGVAANIFKCFYDDCITPVIEDKEIVMADKGNATKVYASEIQWSFDENNMTDFTVDPSMFLIVDAKLPKFKTLKVEGFLEFSNNLSHVFEVQDLSLVNGAELIIGSEEEPFSTDIEIKLSGAYSPISTRRSKRSTIPRSLTMGKIRADKAGISIHGEKRTVSWTELSETANASQSLLRLIKPVDWKSNETIIITTTINNPQDEILTILRVEDGGKTIVLKEKLVYKHAVGSENFPNGLGYRLAARVGLLSRNVRISNGFISSLSGGNIQMSNVEMRDMGHLVDSHTDSPYAINIVGSNSSYIKSCTIVNGTNVLKAYKSDNIQIEDNIIYNSTIYGLQVISNSSVVRRNLAIHFTHDSDIEVTGLITVVGLNGTIEDNFVTDASIGITYLGVDCSNENLNTYSVRNNHVMNSAVAVMVNINYPVQSDCLKISNFIVMFSAIGVYYEGQLNFIGTSNVLVSNTYPIFSHIFSPSPNSHQVADKLSTIKDNLIVAHSNVYECSVSGANYGIFWPIFAGGQPMDPGVTSEGNAQLSGRISISNITFANFNKSCNPGSVVFSSNKKFEDNQFPITVKEVKLFNVDNSSKIIFHRPSNKKINPSDCVDMHCDGLKKNLLIDLDGSLLGAPLSLIPQSEYGWGRNDLGLGDFRIPKELLTDVDGSLIDPKSVYDHVGIVREENLCKYQPAWQCYECRNIDYKPMLIESMDKDTLHRRLSPVAVISSTKYIDLINGPEDIGWCFGYTCQERLSTFMSLVANEYSFDVYLTSTPPQQLRFRVLNADEKFKIRLGMHYFTSMRIDLYLDGKYVAPSNAFYENGHMELTDPGNNVTGYKPTFSDKAGMNYYHKPDKNIYFAMDGTSVIDLKIAPVLFVRFGVPAITAEQFFNKNTVVGNFAHLLGIAPSKIRRVEIVRASRRRRDAGTSYIKLTIEDNAVESANDTAAQDEAKSSMNKLEAQISNLFMTGELQEKAKEMNITLTDLSVKKPMEAEMKPLQKVSNIKVATEASGCMAQVPCTTQPKLLVVDEAGSRIDSIGNSEFPWTVEAYIDPIRNNNRSISLILEQEMVVSNGYVNFTKLGVAENLDNIVISFRFKLPEGLNASKFNPNEVSLKPVTSTNPVLSCTQQGDEIEVSKNSKFTVEVNIIDKATKTAISKIDWNGQSWNANIKLHALGYYKAQGSLALKYASARFDPAKGVATFKDMEISEKGMYLLKFTVNSADDEYNFDCFSKAITVKDETFKTIKYAANTAPNYILKFEGAYDDIEPEEVKANAYNFISQYNIGFAGLQVYSGSVYVSFYSSGTDDNLINDLTNGVTMDPKLVYVYADVNNNILTKEESEDDKVVVGVIAGTVAGAVIGSIVGLLVIFIILLGIREFNKTKAKIHSDPETPEKQKNETAENEPKKNLLESENTQNWTPIF